MVTLRVERLRMFLPKTVICRLNYKRSSEIYASIHHMAAVCRFMSSGASKKFVMPYRIIRGPGIVMGSPPIPISAQRPPYALAGIVFPTPMEIPILNASEIKKMRKACRMTRLILACGRKLIETCGHSLQTSDLENVMHTNIMRWLLYPSMLAYKGYPKGISTAINNVVKYGIPDDTKLQDGDIISVDVSIFQDGFHGDTCQTFPVGDVDLEAENLIRTTEKCVEEAIKICGPGVRFNKIGKVISQTARESGFSVCPYFVGHGIGKEFHGPPQIIHHENSYPGTMRPGMAFTIEPILCTGSPEIKILDDGWTAVTADDGRAAQCEHTILITERGADILTADKEDDDQQAAELIRHFKFISRNDRTWRT